MHAEAAEAPAVTEYRPASQLSHTDAVVAPVVMEYAPAWHLEGQFTAPIAEEKVPASHAKQPAAELRPVLAEYRPAPHAVHAVARGEEEYVPAGHTAHCDDPWLDMNVPGAQGEHGEGQKPSPPSHWSSGSDRFIAHAV